MCFMFTIIKRHRLSVYLAPQSSKFNVTLLLLSKVAHCRKKIQPSRIWHDQSFTTSSQTHDTHSRKNKINFCNNSKGARSFGEGQPKLVRLCSMQNFIIRLNVQSDAISGVGSSFPNPLRWKILAECTRTCFHWWCIEQVTNKPDQRNDTFCTPAWSYVIGLTLTPSKMWHKVEKKD